MPRKVCESCGRPLNVCLCEHLVNVQAPCKVLILQHPSELKQPLATVPILQLCIEPLTVMVGEDFTGLLAGDSEESLELQSILSEPESVRVLFPNDDAEIWQCDAPAQSLLTQPLPSQPLSSQMCKTLIVLDGTWRKAKKIWFSNPWLHELPKVTLQSDQQSQYRLRSTSVEGGMSTLESVAMACNYLSGTSQYDVLYKPFTAMIDMQIKKMGPEVFRAHYDRS